ncbi:Uncharacterised protein [Cedecea neteri]|uniref:Uncharacterized protein n=1 Tax=Cedecea neteri TaxID=158822 RepID=A0A2X3IN19_9ENTR|nr:Uncharacterised protein [Cedecea neteri]
MRQPSAIRQSFITIALWGAAYGALPVLLQTLVFKEASRLEGGGRCRNLGQRVGV